MLNFEYHGIRAGKYDTGQIEALNKEEAADKLKSQKIIITKLVKAKKHLMMLRNAITTTWGPSPRALKWGYNGIILQSFLIK